MTVIDANVLLYAYDTTVPQHEAASRWLNTCAAKGWKGVVEFSGESARQNLTLWPSPGGDFEIMKRIKHMFDPEGLLNSGRLYHLL